MRSPSSLASAAVTSACAAASAVSPAMTKSVADSLVSGMSCATCAMRHCDGTEKSPLSSCRVPFKSANRLDLPAPLRPTRPTFSPGLIDTEALSSRTLALRRRLRFLRMIMQKGAARRTRAAEAKAGFYPARSLPAVHRLDTGDGFPSTRRRTPRHAALFCRKILVPWRRAGAGTIVACHCARLPYGQRHETAIRSKTAGSRTQPVAFRLVPRPDRAHAPHQPVAAVRAVFLVRAPVRGLMQLGKNLSVSIKLSGSPLGFFSGSTCRMSMVSLTLLFIEFRVLRRNTARHT